MCADHFSHISSMWATRFNFSWGWNWVFTKTDFLFMSCVCQAMSSPRSCSIKSWKLDFGLMVYSPRCDIPEKENLNSSCIFLTVKHYSHRQKAHIELHCWNQDCVSSKPNQSENTWTNKSPVPSFHNSCERCLHWCEEQLLQYLCGVKSSWQKAAKSSVSPH